MLGMIFFNIRYDLKIDKMQDKYSFIERPINNTENFYFQNIVNCKDRINNTFCWVEHNESFKYNNNQLIHTDTKSIVIFSTMGSFMHNPVIGKKNFCMLDVPSCNDNFVGYGCWKLKDDIVENELLSIGFDNSDERLAIVG